MHSTEAQQPTKISRIGFLTTGSPSVFPGRIEAFRQGLRELGYVEGKNIVIEWRYAEGQLEKQIALAAELVRLKVDIIVSGGPTATGFLKEATTTIPIVMGFHTDPVVYRSCCQPGSTWREHYWIVSAFPGIRRKTTGAFEGDRSEVIPRGRPREFNPTGQCRNVKGDGTRRRSVGREA